MSLRSWGATTFVTAALVASSGVGSAMAAPTGGSVTSRYVSTEIVSGLPTFGAISGIDKVGNAKYAMISTDVGRLGPARYYTAGLTYVRSEGRLSAALPLISGTVLSPSNLPLLPGDAQFEGIRHSGTGYVVVSGGSHQFVRRIGPGGTYLRDLPLPKAWRPTRTSGVAGQRGLTGIAVGPQGQVSVITAGGLRQDSARSARLLTFGGQEYLYRTDADKVAADILAVNNTDYLVLERGTGRVTRIYWATTVGATPITGAVALRGSERAMRKTEIFSSERVPGLATGNMSAMAWGNWLPDIAAQKYRACMLYVVTNNIFSGPTRVHVVEVRFPRR